MWVVVNSPVALCSRLSLARKLLIRQPRVILHTHTQTTHIPSLSRSFICQWSSTFFSFFLIHLITGVLLSMSHIIDFTTFYLRTRLFFAIYRCSRFQFANAEPQTWLMNIVILWMCLANRSKRSVLANTI